MSVFLNSLLTVSSNSRNRRITILSYFSGFGTRRVHDLLTSGDTAKYRNRLPPNCPSRASRCGMVLSDGETGNTPECCRESVTPKTSTSTLQIGTSAITILSAGVRATGIDRLSKAVYASGGHSVPYDKLVLATGSLPFMPPIGGLHSDDGALLPGIFAFRALGDFSPNVQPWDTRQALHGHWRRNVGVLNRPWTDVARTGSRTKRALMRGWKRFSNRGNVGLLTR